MHCRLTKLFQLTALAFATAASMTAADPVNAQSGREHEVTVTVTRVKALDAADAYSRADFFARVTIDGTVQAVPPVKQQDDIRPNWAISKKVKPGRIAVRLEILDKDLSKEELIDINRLPNRRIQEFVVDTRRCTIEGFAGGLRCGSTITRAGDERKKAEVSFVVTVKK